VPVGAAAACGDGTGDVDGEPLVVGGGLAICALKAAMSMPAGAGAAEPEQALDS